MKRYERHGISVQRYVNAKHLQSAAKNISRIADNNNENIIMKENEKKSNKKGNDATNDEYMNGTTHLLQEQINYNQQELSEMFNGSILCGHMNVYFHATRMGIYKNKRRKMIVRASDTHTHTIAQLFIYCGIMAGITMLQYE